MIAQPPAHKRDKKLWLNIDRTGQIPGIKPIKPPHSFSQEATASTSTLNPRAPSYTAPNGHFQPPSHLASQTITPDYQTNFYLSQALVALQQPATGPPMVRYEQGVIIDSGASKHMTGNPDLLQSQEPYFSEVILADGSVTQSTAKGLV